MCWPGRQNSRGRELSRPTIRLSSPKPGWRADRVAVSSVRGAQVETGTACRRGETKTPPGPRPSKAWPPPRPAAGLYRGDAVCRPSRSRLRCAVGATALAHDVITRLAKLRSLFVHRPGTVFALHERQIAPRSRAMLRSAMCHGTGSALGSDLCPVPCGTGRNENASAPLVWADVFHTARTTRFRGSTRSATGSSLDRQRDRAVERTARCCARRTRWARGRRIIAACTCIGSSATNSAQARIYLQMGGAPGPTFSRALRVVRSPPNFQNAFQGWASPRALGRAGVCPAAQT